MEFVFTKKALKDYEKLPIEIKNTVNKQISYLLRDIKYPSLQAKKYGGVKDIWQIRINNKYRLYFKLENNTYIILTVIKHPK